MEFNVSYALKHYSLWTLLFFLALTACGTSHLKPCEYLNVHYRDELSSLETKKDTSSLLRVLNDVISKDSLCIEAIIARADLYFGLEQYDAAMKDYHNAVRINNQVAYPIYKLGFAFESTDKFDSALYYYDKAEAIKTIGNYVADYKELRDLSMEAGNFDVPYDEIVFRQSISYYYLGNLSKSFVGFTYCINSRYLKDQAFLFRGAINIELNKLDSGCKEFVQAKLFGNLEADSYLNKYCKPLNK